MKRRDFIKGSLVLGGSVLLPSSKAFANPTIISSLPYGIYTPGTYILNQNHSANFAEWEAISVNADDVTIDLQGYTIQNTAGTGTRAVGVFTSNGNIKNFTITNGTLKNFHTALYLSGSCDGANGYLIDNITADNCYAAGLMLSGTGHVVRDCSITSSTRSTLINLGSCSGTLGIGLAKSRGCLIQNTNIDLSDSGNGDGTVCMFFSQATTDSVILNCSFSNADAGIVFDQRNATGDYRGNTSNSVTVPYTGGNDLGSNS
ncbi:hypothetical protein OAO01_08580 [Oligoflexia bacterium]|nr:hypothetical protein [Oligoflexia bacterium]